MKRVWAVILKLLAVVLMLLAIDKVIPNPSSS
jgi:hypothetical protein